MDPGKRGHGRAEWERGPEEKRRAQCVPPRFPIVSANRVMTLLALLPSCLLVVGCQGEVAIAIAIFQLFGIGFPDHD
jgi:hypothetical protein